MSRPILLYVSGPMTGVPLLNFPAFHREAERLRRKGYAVVNPADLNPDPAADWRTCMRADIKALVDCDGIALLPGWEASKGATLERLVAMGLQLSVGTVEDWVRWAP